MLTETPCKFIDRNIKRYVMRVDNKENIIGIIGLGGTIGKCTYQILNKSFSQIYGGQRHISEDNSIKAKWKVVDAFCLDDIKEFGKKCDVLLNCSGPSYFISDNIARTIIDLDIPYIDVFGANVFDKRQYYGNQQYIIGAGSFPGFSGIIIKYLIEKYFDKVDEVKVYYGTNEKISKTAAVDFILSTRRGFTIPSAEIYKSEIIHSNKGLMEPWLLPGTNIKLFLQKCLNQEAIEISSKYNIKNMCWYNTVPSYRRMAELSSIHQELNTDTSETKLFAAAEKMSNMYKGIHSNKSWNFQVTEISGTMGRKTVKKRHIFFTESGNLVTGIVAGLASNLISKSPIYRGVHWAYEIVKYEDVIKELKDNFAKVDCNIIDLVTEYDEGII